MHTLLALTLAAAAAVVVARPPGPVFTTVSQDESPLLSAPTRKYLKEYQNLLPRYIWPHYFAFDESPRRHAPPHRQLPMPPTDWLNQEIQRLSRLQSHFKTRFESDIPWRVPEDSPFIKRMLSPISYSIRNHNEPYYLNQPWPVQSLVSEEDAQQVEDHINVISNPLQESSEEPVNKEKQKEVFALTPLEEGYFEPTEIDVFSASNDMMAEGLHEGGSGPKIQNETQENGNNLVRFAEFGPIPPREIRQNPNLSRAKTLVASDLNQLRVGFNHDEPGPMDKTGQGHLLDYVSADPTGSFYSVAIISAIGAAVVMALLGFVFGWYTLSKRAKAAADVDYPAYGVTGPTVDTSGDRKLAHSAHMYHYQHQKQQIIAMERSGMEQRNGSVSDPDSEEENEEGDYTVYECPGFATTGDMEVKNPLFNDEPTPATPGKCEVVKPQPKD